MNPNYDVILDGLIKRLNERGNLPNDLAYVVSRLQKEVASPMLDALVPKQHECCCDPSQLCGGCDATE